MTDPIDRPGWTKTYFGQWSLLSRFNPMQAGVEEGGSEIYVGQVEETDGKRYLAITPDFNRNGELIKETLNSLEEAMVSVEQNLASQKAYKLRKEEAQSREEGAVSPDLDRMVQDKKAFDGFKSVLDNKESKAP